MTVIDTRPDIEAMHVGMDEPTLDEVVRDMLPAGKYHSIEEIQGGDGTRRAKFRGMWGRNGGSRPVRIKVDKPLEDSKKQERRDRGYDTSNDATVLSHLPYDEALAHGISPILDYEESKGLVVSVEPEFTKGVSLQDFFKDRKPNKQEFNQVISGLTGAVNYAHHQGFFHRDLNGLNSMVRKRGKNLETRLTDWEFAVPKDRVRDAPFNTSGTKPLRDPLLESQPYGDQAEAYQIAMNALTLFSDEPLSWHENEELKDPAKRKEAVRKALGEMPKNLRKRHGRWIERSLSLNPEERFGSFEEFYSAVNKAAAPGFWDKVKSRGRTIAMAAGITGALAIGAGGGLYGYNEKVHAEEIVEASKDRVVPHWNGQGLEITNDKFRLTSSLTMYPGDKEREYQWYPIDHRVLRVRHGDKISFRAEVTGDVEKIGTNQETTLLLPGRLYVDGERFEDGSFEMPFVAWTSGIDEARREYGMGYHNPSNKTFIVPESWEPGVHGLNIEILSPDQEYLNGLNKHEKKNYDEANVRFDNRGVAINRERIPIIVEDPDQEIDIYALGLKGYTEYVGARNLDSETIGGNYTMAHTNRANFFVEVPELGFERQLDREGYGGVGGLGLPNTKGVSEGISYFHVRDGEGEIINFTGVPLRSYGIISEENLRDDSEQIYYWGFGDIDKGFPQRLVDYKESLPEVDKQEVDESDRQ